MNFRIALWGIVIIETLIVVLGISLDGYSLVGLQTITMFSGRFSLVIFSLIFIFNRKPGNFDKLFFGKPYLIFCVAHTIHLGELLFYQYQAGKPLIPLRILGGFVAYLFIFIMPYLSHKFEKGLIYLKHFLIIEQIYLFYIWFIFFMVYISRVRGVLPDAGGNPRDHFILLGWVSLLMGMKIMGLLTFKPRNNL